jgi:hypothetical protein
MRNASILTFSAIIVTFGAIVVTFGAIVTFGATVHSNCIG